MLTITECSVLLGAYVLYVLLCALCMGNDKYDAPGQPFAQLDACCNDAKTVAKRCVIWGGIGHMLRF